jgi:hypothetical protein
LAARKFDLTTPELRDSLLHFYTDLSVPIDTKKDTAQWQAVLTSLDQLKSVTPIPPVLGAAQHTPSLPIAVTPLAARSSAPAGQKVR